MNYAADGVSRRSISSEQLIILIICVFFWFLHFADVLYQTAFLTEFRVA